MEAMIRGLASVNGFIARLGRRPPAPTPAEGVPVVASGGAGTLDHMVAVLAEGKADAVLAASIFHFGEYTVTDVKHHLARHGVPVRLPETVAN